MTKLSTREFACMAFGALTYVPGSSASDESRVYNNKEIIAVLLLGALIALHNALRSMTAPGGRRERNVMR